MTKDVHDLLLEKMHEYFDRNLHWEGRRTHVAGIELRRLLSEIRRLCSERRNEIQAIRDKKPKLKSPKYRNSVLKEEREEKS